MAQACIVDVSAAFVVTFCVPYLIKPQYANLSSKVGFIFGGFTTLYFVWAVFCMPELKNRSLEEVDELFEEKLWAWQFSKYKTKGLAGRVTHHEIELSEKHVPREHKASAAQVEDAAHENQ